ncbi:hypothetical protein B0H16DRAFT_1541142 [Mycena metata]|uniref:Uncharacterized protein n=1 Tax=Mycena metata TaxID=1033252 RepID=A0AAD7J1M7_9AGAR|nr:hypothetical protein B0H16DRAFT_1541142 [Mycena metata]
MASTVYRHAAFFGLALGVDTRRSQVDDSTAPADRDDCRASCEYTQLERLRASSRRYIQLLDDAGCGNGKYGRGWSVVDMDELGARCAGMKPVEARNLTRDVSSPQSTPPCRRCSGDDDGFKFPSRLPCIRTDSPDDEGAVSEAKLRADASTQTCPARPPFTHGRRLYIQSLRLKISLGWSASAPQRAHASASTRAGYGRGRDAGGDDGCRMKWMWMGARPTRTPWYAESPFTALSLPTDAQATTTANLLRNDHTLVPICMMTRERFTRAEHAHTSTRRERLVDTTRCTSEDSPSSTSPEPTVNESMQIVHITVLPESQSPISHIPCALWDVLHFKFQPDEDARAHEKSTFNIPVSPAAGYSGKSSRAGPANTQRLVWISPLRSRPPPRPRSWPRTPAAGLVRCVHRSSCEGGRCDGDAWAGR